MGVSVLEDMGQKIDQFGRTTKRNEERFLSLIKSLLKVLKRNVPAGIIWYQGGKVRTLGTQNLVKWVENQDKETLEKVIELDQQSLINGDEPLMCDDDVSDETLAATLLQDQMASLDISRLPYPLSLMNKKEKVKYIATHIYDEFCHKQQDFHVKIIYGNPDFRPSFWPENLWTWENCKRSIHSIKDHLYTGSGTFADFLTTCIKNLFAAHDRDPEKFYKNDASNKKKIALLGGSYTADEKMSVNQVMLVEDQDDDNFDAPENDHEEKHATESEIDRLVESPESAKVVTRECYGKRKELDDYDDHKNSAQSEQEISLDWLNEDEKETKGDDDSPVSITINSKGFEPIHITLNKLKKRKSS